MNSIGKAVNSQLQTGGGGGSGAGAKYAENSKSKINWNDFNYPPLIKVIHYNPSELMSPHLGVARLLWLSFVMVFVVSWINLLNNIIQVAGSEGEGIRIGYSVVFFILFNPLAGVIFYKGLRAFLEEDSFLIFQGGAGVLGIAYIVFAIAKFGNFNGFTRISDVSAFPAILCVIESIIFLLIAAINGFVIYRAIRWDNGPAQINDPSGSSSNNRSQSQVSQP